MSRRREQLSLALEADSTSGEELPPEEALLQALAELLLEAYGQDPVADPGDPVPRGTADEH
jgi:hypothetical protein